MSIKIMSSVWELALSQAEKLVLLAFADHADDSGRCWPSLVRVAWKSGLGHRQVQRVVRKLIEKKLLVAVAGKFGGRGTTVIYEVRAQKGDKLTPFDGYRQKFLSRKGGPRDAERATSEAEKGDIAMSPESPLNRTTLQPPEKRERKSAGADVALSPSGRSTQFMQLWNEGCGTLPKVREITGSRARKLAARCRERPDFEREFLAAVRKAAQTPFLLGENDRGWRASFDWLIRDDTKVVAVLEGEYEKDRNRGRRGAVPAAKPNGGGKFAAYNRKATDL